MPADLVASQFCSLEKSLSALAIDAESPEESVLKSVLSALDNCKKNAGDI
jgi:gluconate kinase